MNVAKGHNKADGLGEVYDLTTVPSFFQLNLSLSIPVLEMISLCHNQDTNGC